MAHINVKPLEITSIYDSPEDAINHVLAYRVFSKHWNFGGKAFGHTTSARRAIDTAIKTKNASAFVALKRRGYWRVELASTT
jgi:hypothetical protein